MQTLPVIPVAARAARNDNPGIVPPWLDRPRNPGIVPPWLQHPIVLPVEPEAANHATTTGFDPQPVVGDDDTPRIWGA